MFPSLKAWLQRITALSCILFLFTCGNAQALGFASFPLSSKISSVGLFQYLPWSWQILQALNILVPQDEWSMISAENRAAEDRIATVQDLASYLPLESSTLRIWLLNDSAEAYRHELEAVENFAPQLSIELTPFADEDIYFSELEKAVQRDALPDIFLIDSGWTQRLINAQKLAAAPAMMLKSEDLQDDFWPIAQDFLHEDQIFAAPLFGVFPILYANRALLRDSRIFVAERPGTSWAELAANLNRFKEFGDTKVSVLPLHDSKLMLQLFLLLLRQSEATIISGREASDALSFLLSIATLPNPAGRDSVTAFAAGKVALLFGDEAVLEQIRKAMDQASPKNTARLLEPNLMMELLPQYRSDRPSTIGTAWGLAVAAGSKLPDLAWALSTLLTNSENSALHFSKTQCTPLRKAISNDIFSQSAALAVSRGAWRDLDFSGLFAENIRAHLNPEKGIPARSVSEMLQNFSAFFAAHDSAE